MLVNGHTTDVIVVDVFKSGGKIKHAVLATKEILKYRMVTVPPFTVKIENDHSTVCTRQDL